MLGTMLGIFHKLILTPHSNISSWVLVLQLDVGPKIKKEEIETWRFPVMYYTVCIIAGT